MSCDPLIPMLCTVPSTQKVFHILSNESMDSGWWMDMNGKNKYLYERMKILGDE